MSNVKPIGLASDEHVTDTVSTLEEALADAKSGKLSAVIIFGDCRGTDLYFVWQSGHENYLSVVGKLQQACTDLCLKHHSKRSRDGE
jgi:predicted phosphodiesterase